MAKRRSLMTFRCGDDSRISKKTLTEAVAEFKRMYGFDPVELLVRETVANQFVLPGLTTRVNMHVPPGHFCLEAPYSKATILKIRNHQCAACGPPPFFDDDKSYDYYGYHMNQHGEQVIFICSAETGQCVLRHGDAGWENEYPVTALYRKDMDPDVAAACQAQGRFLTERTSDEEFVLQLSINISNIERRWLESCWLACRTWREGRMADAHLPRVVK